MDAALKKRWVAALRSGKYKQGEGFLNPAPKYFCCLGVLCDIHPDVEWVHEDDDAPPVAAYKDSWEDTALPLNLSDELQISIQDEEFLIHINDTEKATFSQIADWIEENL